MTRRISWVIILGDAIALLLFAYGGEVSHELFFPDSLLLSVLFVALPFALAWFPAAYVLGALTDARLSRPPSWVARAVGAWLIAAPLGIVVRGWLINRAVIPMAFLLVTYAMGLTLLVGWRLLFIVARKFIAKGVE